MISEVSATPPRNAPTPQRLNGQDQSTFSEISTGLREILATMNEPIRSYPDRKRPIVNKDDDLVRQLKELAQAILALYHNNKSHYQKLLDVITSVDTKLQRTYEERAFEHEQMQYTNLRLEHLAERLDKLSQAWSQNPIIHAVQQTQKLSQQMFEATTARHSEQLAELERKIGAIVVRLDNYAKKTKGDVAQFRASPFLYANGGSEAAFGAEQTASSHWQNGLKKLLEPKLRPQRKPFNDDASARLIEQVRLQRKLNANIKP